MEWQEAGNELYRREVGMIFNAAGTFPWAKRHEALMWTVVRACDEDNPITPFLARLALQDHIDIDAWIDKTPEVEA